MTGFQALVSDEFSCISVNEEASHFVRGDLLSEETEEKPRKKRPGGQRFLRGFFLSPSHARRPEGGAKRRLKDLLIYRNAVFQLPGRGPP